MGVSVVDAEAANVDEEEEETRGAMMLAQLISPNGCAGELGGQQEGRNYGSLNHGPIWIGGEQGTSA